VRKIWDSISFLFLWLCAIGTSFPEMAVVAASNMYFYTHIIIFEKIYDTMPGIRCELPADGGC